MKKWLLVLVLIAMLVGCEYIDPNASTVPADVPVPSAVRVITIDNVPVYRFIDTDFGVVCWFAVDNTGNAGVGGISCIPLADLEKIP